MPHEEPPASFVRFVPSKVVGRDGVREVAIGPDRLMLRTENEWLIFHLGEMARRVAAFAEDKLFRSKKDAVIGELRFDRVAYTDSFVRFATVPPVSVYMPTGRPTEYPHSDFWKIQERVRSGGFCLVDHIPETGIIDAIGDAPEPAAWRRPVARVLSIPSLIGAACFLFAIAMNFLPGFLFSWLEFPVTLSTVACRDNEGRIYTGHPEIGRIQRYSADGVFEFGFSGRSGGVDFFIDTNGTLVSSEKSDRFTYSADGKLLARAKTAASPPGKGVALRGSPELVPDIRSEDGQVLVKGIWWRLPIGSPYYAFALMATGLLPAVFLNPRLQVRRR